MSGSRAASSKAGAKEWVDSNFVEPVQEGKSGRFSYQDSAFDLKTGCEVSELDTIPGELLDHFK